MLVPMALTLRSAREIELNIFLSQRFLIAKIFSQARASSNQLASVCYFPHSLAHSSFMAYFEKGPLQNIIAKKQPGKVESDSGIIRPDLDISTRISSYFVATQVYPDIGDIEF